MLQYQLMWYYSNISNNNTIQIDLGSRYAVTTQIKRLVLTGRKRNADFLLEKFQRAYVLMSAILVALPFVSFCLVCRVTQRSIKPFILLIFEAKEDLAASSSGWKITCVVRHVIRLRQWEITVKNLQHAEFINIIHRKVQHINSLYQIKVQTEAIQVRRATGERRGTYWCLWCRQ